MSNTRKFCKCGNPCTTNGRCSECRAIYQKQWYQAHKEEHKQRARKWNDIRHKEVTDLIRELKSAPCVECGQKFHFSAMDFDHIEGKKEFGIARAKYYGRDKLKPELSKCQVICSNCHRVRTYNRLIVQRKEQCSPKA